MQQGGGGSWPLTRVCSSNSPPLLWARGLGPRSVLSSLEPGFADRAPGSERVPEVPGVTQAIRCPRFPPDAWTVTPLGDPCLGNPVSRGSPDPRRGPIQECPRPRSCIVGNSENGEKERGSLDLSWELRPAYPAGHTPSPFGVPRTCRTDHGQAGLLDFSPQSFSQPPPPPSCIPANHTPTPHSCLLEASLASPLPSPVRNPSTDPEGLISMDPPMVTARDITEVKRGGRC
ncbi:proline-rich protein 36-like [Sus scrofa]|uniref:proline-rich protein 36-like n=1 Tax=Sus scrofa TaxID=9823 RepID=UPI000A2B14EF|nr:proline-rich protein 36-like [Sus scrofa]